MTSSVPTSASRSAPTTAAAQPAPQPADRPREGTMSAIAARPSTTARTGRAPTLCQLGLLIQWQARRSAEVIPLLVIVQTLLAATTVFGYGLLIGTPEPHAAMYLATGAATVNLIMVGLVLTPQAVAQSKTEGSLAWMRTLPVPRWAYLAADLVVYALVALPGSVLGLVLGAWRFDVTLSLSPWLAVAAPLVALIATAVGYSIALLLKPQVAQLASQVLVFVVLLFSPISIPMERLPGWLATTHEWLPVAPMADLMRATLLSDEFTMPARSTIVLAAWTVLALFGTGRALARRS